MTTFFDVVQDINFRTFVCNQLAEGTENRDYLFPDTLPKLYKYRSLSDYAINDVINNRIPATRIGEFNDLFDGAMHRYGTKEERERAAEKEWDKMEQLRIAAKFPEGLLEHDYYVGIHMNHFKRESRLKFRELDYLGTFVCCLSSQNDSTLMWSHYAASNTGICIQYDFNSIKEDSLLRKIIFPVAYSKKPVDLRDLLADQKEEITKYPLDAAVLCAALNKATVWKYEREWRIVLVIATEQINDRRLPLIAPCPSSISFGYHFLRPFFYYDYKNEIECINASSCIKNVKKLLEHLVKAKIPITVMVPTIGGYQLIPRAISVEALQYLVCKHFRNDKPENMRYYYVVHDQLMDLIEETNHHA